MKTEKEPFSGKQMAALIIPLILEQILGNTMGMVNSMMVSSAGEAAVSGVSQVASRYLGENKKKEAIKTSDQLLLCMVGIATVIMVFSLCRAMGNSKITMNIFILMNLVNIAGNGILIMGFRAGVYGAATSTLISRMLGAGKVDEAKCYVKKLMVYAYIGMVLINTAICLAAPIIVGCYHVTEETTRIADKLVIFHSVCATVLWPAGFALPNALRANYDATFTMVVSIGSMWIFRIGFSYLLSLQFHMGLFGVWAAMAVDWVFRSGCFLWRMKSGHG